MKFNIVCADPPWGSFKDKLKMSDVKRGAEANYSTMTTEDICNLPVKQIADPNGCVLALWVPSSLLLDGIKVMDAWSFVVKQTYVWCKTKKQKDNEKLTIDDCLSFGMGRLFRQSHEIALIGTNNNGIYKQLENRSQRSVSFGENLKHSAKPEHLQNSLDLMFPPPKDGSINRLEMFARRERQGWITLGNEIPPYEDIKVSLDKIIVREEIRDLCKKVING
jgi:N6-adenosine-specific RNA methylase IME4